MTTVSTVCRFLDEFAPPKLAAAWDNVGLLLGDPAAGVSKVMTCLTVTRSVVEEAVEAGVDLIVSHHPILFKGAKKLTTASGDGAIVWPLAKAGIAVYSPHTSFDNTVGGINDQIAMKLGLTQVRPLRPAVSSQCKIVVFTPDADLAKVSDALFSAGAGLIGQYSQCSYRLAGTGTFFAPESANPTVGVKGRREEVAEWRLEVVCPETSVDAAVRAMRKAHSYEEPAYDVYPLRGGPTGHGEGRIGRLPAPTTLGTLAQVAKANLPATYIQTVGDLARPIETVALACGAAGEFLQDAIRQRADVFLTGEMRFHDCLLAESEGIGVLLPGHYATERPAVEALANMLNERWPGIEVWPSKRESDPLRSLA